MFFVHCALESALWQRLGAIKVELEFSEAVETLIPLKTIVSPTIEEGVMKPSCPTCSAIHISFLISGAANLSSYLHRISFS